MNTVVQVMLSNAVVVAGLFALLLLVRRWMRNPAVFHVLALLLLVKLLVPWGWQPTLDVLPQTQPKTVGERPDSRGTSQAPPSAASQGFQDRPDTSGTDALITESIAAAPALDAESQVTIAAQPITSTVHHATEQVAGRSTESPAWSIQPAALIGFAWLIGTIVWLVISIRRIQMFRNLLHHAKPAPDEIQELATTLARRLGLKHSPRIAIVPGKLSPVLWSLGGSPQILLPAGLLDRLDDDERQTLLLHELAHYRRGDHWVRLVEFAATGVYWWYPVLWWLRQELRLAEEQCCDARVVESHPDLRRAYAEALVKMAGGLHAPALVPGTTGIGSTHRIEERITRIMRGSLTGSISGVMKAAIAIFAIGLLSCAPMLGQSSADNSEPDAAVATTDQESEAASESIVGQVVTTDGQPVPGVTVDAFVNFVQWPTPFVTDEQGAIEVPAEWRYDERTRDQVVLVARGDDDRLGWYGFRPGRDEDLELPLEFQMVLVPIRVIQGQFVHRGEPVAEVQMALDFCYHEKNGHFSQNLLATEDRLPSGVSDPSGRFSVRVPSDSALWMQPDHLDWVQMEVRAEATLDDLGLIVLHPAGRIEGQVLNADTGDPMVGHTIFVQALNSDNLRNGFPSYGDAKVDAEGRYVIGGLPPAPFNVLHGSPRDEREWTAPAHEHIDVVVGRGTTVDFEVIRGQRLAGRVVEGRTGEPLANIPVGYYGTARPDSGAACMMVRTQDDGTYEFFVPPGVSRVYVAAGDRGSVQDSSRTVRVNADRPLEPVDLKAGPEDTGTSGAEEVVAAPREPGAEPQRNSYEAHIRLVPPDGMAVTKVEVRTVFRGAQYTSQWAGRSGASLDVPFHEREEGAVAFFLIDAKGFQPLRSPEFTVLEDMPELTVPLQPEVLVPIRGRAVDSNGDPVADARVRIRRRLYGREMQFPWGLEYSTDEQGIFEIEHVRVSDRVQIRLDSAGVGALVTDWIEPTVSEAITLGDVVIAPPDQELGGVVRDYDGFPVPDARVSLRENQDVVVETDAEGAFRLEGAPMGEVELTIHSAGFPADTRKAIAGVLDNQIRVNRISNQDREDYQVDVHLETSDNKVPSNVTLYWCVEGGRHLSTMPDRQGNDFTIGFANNVRRAEGRPFAVIIKADGYAISQPAIVLNQRNPEAVTIRLNSMPEVTIRGRVVDADGSPVADALVGTSLKLTDEDNDEPWHYFRSESDLPVTDSEGRFEIPGIHAGSQMAVYVNREGYAGVLSERVTVTDAVTTLPDLVLPEGASEISGRVLDESGAPVEGAVVTLLDLGSAQITTDAEGRFRFADIGDREYPVRARAEIGEWYDTVSAGTLDVEATLSSRR